MRRFLVLFAPLFWSSASAQLVPRAEFRPMMSELRQRGLLPDPPAPEKSALDPRGSQAPQTATGDLPEGQEIDPNAPEIRLIEVPHFQRTGDTVRFWGGVHIQSKGYDLFADEIVGNTVTQVFTLKGGGKLLGAGAVIEGETVTIDFKNKTFLALRHRGEIRPSLLQSKTLDSVYTRGDEAEGSEKEIVLKGAATTTCDLEERHYELDARMTTIRPGKRIIFRDARLRILGKTVLRIPYLSIPLDTRRERYTPEIGRSTDEGYYIKTVWGIPLNGPRTLDAYLDYFERLGGGVGGRYRYAGDKLTGYLRAYTLIGNQSSTEISVGHRQFFGDHQFALESNYQERNYINAPQNTTWTTRANYTIPQGKNTTRFNFTRYSNDGSSFQTVASAYSLQDQRFYAGRIKTDLEVSYVTNKSSFTSSPDVTREQIDVRFVGSQDLKKLIAQLDYNRSIPVGETANFFTGTDRTPVLTLKSDSQRAIGGMFARNWPIQAEFSVGEFANPSRSEFIRRVYFDVNLSKPEISSGRHGLTLQTRIRQGIYSDDTAQLSGQINATYRYIVNRETGFNLRYSYLKAHGFTPLSIDRNGGTNFVSADVSAKMSRSFTLGLQSGYDLKFEENGLNTPWQQVALRAEYSPSQELLARGLSVYDPIVKKWSSTRIDVTFAKSDFYFGVGARYDGIRSKWSNVNLYLDGLKFRRFTFTALLAFNGYTSRIDSQQLQVVYDMHCTEAVLQVIENNVGFRSGRQYNFFIRIKAFPYNAPFGIGRGGQPLGTATGIGF